LTEAREKAAEARRLLAAGQDPKSKWQQASRPVADLIFGAVALQLIQDRRGGWKSCKHAAQWESTLRTYCSAIWEKPVDQIDVEDILNILRPIWATKQETAHRVRGRIEAVLTAAKVRKLRSGENPALWKGNLDHLLAKRRKGPKRHHAAMPFAEVPLFVAQLRERTGLAARALELVILTASRTSEVLHARWSEFDLAACVWTVPAERMKAGKEHRIPLSPVATDLLQRLPRESDFVFPGARLGAPLSNMAMENVLRRMKLKPYTVHGFRSSFRDWCGEMTEFPRELAEQALAHAVGSQVERAYRRGDALERRRELMDAWATFLTTE
jgi:integrase